MAAINASTNGITTDPGALTHAHKMPAGPAVQMVRMRGLNGATRVYWTSHGPDPAGAGSGYGYGVLTDVVIMGPTPSLGPG